MLCLLSLALPCDIALLRFGQDLALPCFQGEAPPLGSDTGSWAWPEGTHHATAGPYRGALLPPPTVPQFLAEPAPQVWGTGAFYVLQSVQIRPSSSPSSPEPGCPKCAGRVFCVQ